MKVKIELDISPQEVLEIFEGNVETVQKTLMALFMGQMNIKTNEDNFAMNLWQEYLERSKEFFDSVSKTKDAE